jgi:predicted ATPase
MADKGAAVGGATVPISETKPSARVKLQADYAQAVLWSKGFAADETKAAFERTRDLAAKAEFSGAGFPALYGQFVWRLFRGEASTSREVAKQFLQEAEADGRVAETAVAHRLLGLACTYCGDLAEARRQLELALDSYVRERDSEVIERFGQDTGVAARAYLAYTLWFLGDPHRARQCIQDAMRLSGELDHLPSTIVALVYKLIVESARNDPQSVVADAENLLRISQQHGMDFYYAICRLYLSWTRGRLGGARSGADELRNLLAAYTSQGNRFAVPWFLGLLAELEAAAGDFEHAFAAISEGLASAQDGGQHYVDAFLHRLRGDILLKRNLADPGPAEEAYRTAIAIAKEQGARSYELLASLALAKLYQLTGRPAEAHAVLAPVLEGFSLTSEMPEIAEGQTLLKALAETEEVKAAEAQRQRRLHLQMAYGQAMMWAKGYAAEETKAAFARAAELAGRIDDFSQRFAALTGQVAAAGTRGELRSACELSLTVLREAEETRRIGEAGLANQWLGLIAYWRGDFLEARTHFERAVAARDPNPDLKLLVGDPSTFAASQSAPTAWALGELQRARELIDTGTQRALESGHIGAIVNALFFKSYLEVWRDDPTATLSAAEALELVAQEHGIAQYLNEAELHLGWARGRMNDPMAGAAQIQRVLAAFVEQGVKVNLGFYTGLLAQLEVETLGVEAALARIDEAFRLSEQVEHGCSLPFLHRLRGEVLLKRNPADPAPAEEAFRTSIAIAKEQSARSPVLLASLALAKLLQSTGRSVEAHAVLAPAPEGFVPTPEMPEIAEAQVLLASLAKTEEVKTALAQRKQRL